MTKLIPIISHLFVDTIIRENSNFCDLTYTYLIEFNILYPIPAAGSLSLVLPKDTLPQP